jgi:hypothetical protein
VTWLWSGLKEIYGLFVDDGWLSLEICLWLMVVWLLLPQLVASPSVRPIFMFIGLAVLLVSSVGSGIRAQKGTQDENRDSPSVSMGSKGA